MKKTLLLSLLLGLFYFTNSCTQPATTEQKLSVEERMAKARAAKSEKKSTKNGTEPDGNGVSGGNPQKATPADYNAPVDKVLKGPNGEVVHTGERGARYYINKNGNKTYLSSNQ